LSGREIGPYTLRLTFGEVLVEEERALAERLGRIRERIALASARAGRAPESVRLLPISKGSGAHAVRAAMALGLTEFGENRGQEADAKIQAGGPGPRWHLVGHLQRNKAKRAVSLFDEIHSLDGEALVTELGRRAADAGKIVAGYAEVNTSGDAAKHGTAPGSTLRFLEQARGAPAIRLQGLMTIGPLRGGSEGARSSFRLLARLRGEAIAAGLLDPDAGLSMGMTDDFEIAVEEGATIVRIGSALFGTRA
jgi:pyridoxal phosphate enzyme (YggS family)